MIFDRAKQLFELQAKARRLQKELRATEVVVEELSGKIKVVVSGEQKVKELLIDPSLLNEGSKNDLEHFLKSALNSALSQAQERAANKMKEVTGNVDIAGLLGGK